MPLEVLPERIVRIDHVPGLAALLGDGGAGAVRQHVVVVRIVEGELVALLVGQLAGPGAGVDEHLLLLRGDGRSGERAGRVHRVEDGVDIEPVVHLRGLVARDVRLVLVIDGDHRHLAGEFLVGLHEVVGGHLGGLVRSRSGDGRIDPVHVGEEAELDSAGAVLRAGGAGGEQDAKGSSATHRRHLHFLQSVAADGRRRGFHQTER